MSLSLAGPSPASPAAPSPAPARSADRSQPSLVAVLRLLIPIAALLAMALLAPSAVEAGWLSLGEAVVVMGVVPILAAVFCSPAMTGAVAACALAGGMFATVMVPGADESVAGLAVPLAVLIVMGSLACVAALLRASRPSFVAGLAAFTPRRVPPLPQARNRDVDELTGLPTGPAALRDMAGSAASSEAWGLLDVNGLRRVNAAHGPAIGDECLQAIGGRLRYRLPERDVVARWQGDEFLVVLRDHDGQPMEGDALERVLACVNAQPIRTADGLVRLSATLTVVERASDETVSSIVDRLLAARAHQALLND